jgi:hypothetical protein
MSSLPVTARVSLRRQAPGPAAGPDAGAAGLSQASVVTVTFRRAPGRLGVEPETLKPGNIWKVRSCYVTCSIKGGGYITYSCYITRYMLLL